MICVFTANLKVEIETVELTSRVTEMTVSEDTMGSGAVWGTGSTASGITLFSWCNIPKLLYLKLAHTLCLLVYILLLIIYRYIYAIPFH